MMKLPVSPPLRPQRKVSGGHLERLGYGYPANTIARLAKWGFATKGRYYARYRINGLHPERMRPAYPTLIEICA